MITENFNRRRELQEISIHTDLVVAGGGLTGVCCAIAAAREGLEVVLVQDRPVLGGNASSEVRIWALGATSHMGNNNRWSREGGIIDEILVENTYRNKEGNPVFFDMVLIDKVLSEKNITLLLNTVVYDVEKKDDRTIAGVTAFNDQNEIRYKISASYFADCTGDGTLGYLAGASYRQGAEDSNVYGEGFAPDKKSYGEFLGHSIIFYVKDTGKPVRFTAPEFALKNAEKFIPKLHDPLYFNVGQQGCKYWWLEYGGRFDTIKDTEKIKFELWKVVYGVWDYIKNSGKFPQAANLTLEWAGLISGKRESRRFIGLYTISQKDLIGQIRHYDDVAFGGWAIDLHPSDGVYAEGKACNQWHSKGVYGIPYRCYVSPDLGNLFIGGRIMSSSHVANGSTRVMCTSALGGEVIGRAAAICMRTGLGPSGLALPENIQELQTRLISNGNFIPGLELKNNRNMLCGAKISASSELKLGTLAHDGSWFRLDYPAAQLIPVERRAPSVRMDIIADEDTELTVELRSSSRRENYTPDVTDEERMIALTRGENHISIDFGHEYDSSRYVFICFMANPAVQIPQSSMIVSGLTAVFNHINPAVSNFGRQDPPEGIGVESFEFWCPKRRPEARNIAMNFEPALDCFRAENVKSPYYRPYLGTNAWVAASDDKRPWLRVEFGEQKTIGTLKLFFDTDADNAMETVQMGHSESVMPCCIRGLKVIDDGGSEIAEIKNNHSSMREISFVEPVTTCSMTIVPEVPDGNVLPGLMGVFAE